MFFAVGTDLTICARARLTGHLSYRLKVVILGHFLISQILFLLQNRMLDTNNSQSYDPLKWSGILLIVSGLVHIPIWLADGSSWEGSVSWRKPILFGISTGMTLWSLSWLEKNLNRRWLDSVVGWIVSVSLVVEVALITLQRWRGTASHFNHTTTFDEIVDFASVRTDRRRILGHLLFHSAMLWKANLER